MLIKCPECELQVSDKAHMCPHCGYQLIVSSKEAKTRTKKKRKRLPNGFGQISEIKGQNLREPYRAMVTVGKDANGKPICKTLKPKCYFKTYNEAYEALLEYNKNPYDLSQDIELSELYERWSEIHFTKLKSVGSIRMYKAAWDHSKELHNYRVRDIKPKHIRNMLDSLDVSANVKSRIKSMLNMLLDYAVEQEIVDKNSARLMTLDSSLRKTIEQNRKGHITFADWEINELWNAVETTPYVDMVLIQCYMGWRPQELCLLKVDDVNTNDWEIIGGMKTDAGYRRMVPIVSFIRPLVLNRLENARKVGSKYLFVCDDSLIKGDLEMTYNKYIGRFNKILDRLELKHEHRAHDPRVFFVTTCKKYGVDDFAIKRMIGHEIDDITEKLYTRRPKTWFHEELSKIDKN